MKVAVNMRASLLFLSSQKEIAMGILAIVITLYMRTTATPIRIFWMKPIDSLVHYAKQF